MLWEGKIDFQGSHEELKRLNHPIVREFKESILHLGQELNGDILREMLNLRYNLTSE